MQTNGGIIPTIPTVRDIYDHHFIISDHEKIFGSSTDNQVTHLIISEGCNLPKKEKKVKK